jgi:exodeoxyribonuclease VII small subunit
MGKTTNTETKPEITFEEAIQSLEQIVKDMESERLPLDQLVHRYEEGSRLLRTCEQRIREAEQRIELIAAGESGPELKAFEAPAKQAPAAPAEGENVKAGGAKTERTKKVPLAKETVPEEEDSGEEEIQLF